MYIIKINLDSLTIDTKTSRSRCIFQNNLNLLQLKIHSTSPIGLLTDIS